MLVDIDPAPFGLSGVHKVLFGLSQTQQSASSSSSISSSVRTSYSGIGWDFLLYLVGFTGTETPLENNNS